MNAINLLAGQHRALKRHLDAYGRIPPSDPEARRAQVVRFADALAAHIEIEERHFYPATEFARSEELLVESLQEHLTLGRLLGDLLQLDPADPVFEGRLLSLRDLLEHHIEEEEADLFASVARLMDEEQLEVLGQRMEAGLRERTAALSGPG